MMLVNETLHFGWNLSRLIYPVIVRILLYLLYYFVYTIINQIGSVPIQRPTVIRIFVSFRNCHLVLHRDRFSRETCGLIAACG